jgi:HD-like signal output (HDOD) protein/CheY-like chemotaxis protein
MPKRLLFVDDEPLVLDGLRRALHGMRGEWEMRFTTTPAAALEAMEKEPFDAIISDMRMPLMDGAELLERVKERHCDVVRIILSGQSKKETILRSISPAHQFLSKPCNIQELKQRLSQAFLTRDLLRNQSLASIVSRLRSVPSLPTLYNELSAALQSEDTSLGQIEQIISRDVGMAAKILQLANSAFVGAHSHVSSLREAVSLIGAETVRSLTLSIHVFSRLDRHSSAAVYLPPLWEHSVAVASLAQRIANLETGSKTIAEECFTAGLLHDIGKIVLLAEMLPEYKRVFNRTDPDTRSFHDAEVEYLGCSHELVGAYLMGIWGLPIAIIQAVQFHHRPSETITPGFSALTAVHCADAVTSFDDKSPLNCDLELDTARLESLGLMDKVELWRALHEEYLAAAAERNAGAHSNIFK